jgi:uncharacterized protein
MTHHTLINVQGGVVTGDRFWDRDAEMAMFAEKVDEGAHLLLVAQRRMGKTSLMREAAERLKDRYICLFVDLQKARSAPDAVVELTLAARPHTGLFKRAKDLFRNMGDGMLNAVEEVDLAELGLKLRAGLTVGNWEGRADELLNILSEQPRPVLLLFDEVPILVNRMLKGDDFKITPERRAAADQFMSWLRKSSLEHQGRLRFVISGSIGLEPVLRQAQLSATINNFTPFELKPWDAKTAQECLVALAQNYGVDFEDAVPAAMTTKLGCCIPHHVQMFFSHVRDHCKRQDRSRCTLKDVTEVYDTEMLGTRGHAELTHYEERLKQVLGEGAFALALEMLTEAAVVRRLTEGACVALHDDYDFPECGVAEVQKEILWVLEHDGYLKPGPDGYVFVSKLLRDWWKARHGFTFTAILERGQ